VDGVQPLLQLETKIIHFPTWCATYFRLLL